MSKKRRKVTRRERVALAKQWPSLFPVVLLIFGPPPNPLDFGEQHCTDYADARMKYYGIIKRWFHDNYLDMYGRPPAIVRGLSDGFMHEYQKWWEKQVSRLKQT